MGDNGTGATATGSLNGNGLGSGGAFPPVLIAAGGTGGHVIPAQAVATVFRRRWPHIPVEFVCGMRPVELRAYWNHREHPYLLRCGKAPGYRWAGLQRWVQLLRVIGPANTLVSKLCPRIVLGMGGYIAAPILLSAWRKGIPIVLHESNAVSGRTTRLFSYKAREVLLSYESAARGLASRTPRRVVGTPVRPDLFEISRPYGAAVFELDPSLRTLLVLGGSQGARSLNSAVLELLPGLDSLAERLGDLQVIWSSGAANHGELVEAIARMELAHIQVRIEPMIQRMDAAYASADLVITRAGAGTLSEISALGLPSILVPFPHAKDDHQRHNAQSLTSAGAAVLVEESGLQPGELLRLTRNLLGDPGALQQMARAAKTLATPKAADEVAETLFRVGYPECQELEFVPEAAAPSAAVAHV